MKKFLRILLPVLLIVGAVCFVAVPEASALTLQEGAEAARCDGCPRDLFGDNGAFRQITNTILYIVGIVAVIMLIIGGIKYVISGGDAKKVTDAKNTVLYAIIGLIITFLAFAIVNFVISALPSSDKQESNQTSLVIESANS
jgi:cytochrome bd-type quinol oxidase subunit 2